NDYGGSDSQLRDHVANKSSDIVRIYLAPDANCLLSVADHCLRSRDYVNLETAPFPSQREAIIRILRLLDHSKMPTPVAVGHRVVHGGPRLRHHCLIDGEVLRQLEA